ncbi:MAG TPA: hypothetical protein VG841_15765 [Caulobacterales bacterium]|nr:hypothetical protein [Caulobacterales bacterium]
MSTHERDLFLWRWSRVHERGYARYARAVIAMFAGAGAVHATLEAAQHPPRGLIAEIGPIAYALLSLMLAALLGAGLASAWWARGEARFHDLVGRGMGIPGKRPLPGVADLTLLGFALLLTALALGPTLLMGALAETPAN